MTTCHILTRASTQRVPVTVQSANSYLFLKLEWGLPEHTRHHDPAERISTAFPCCLANRDMLSPEEDLLIMPTRAKTFIALAIVPGLMMLALGISHWESDDPVRFTIYLLLALIASTLKVRLPGLTGTMSLNFLFILIGVSQLSSSETLLVGAIATAMQCVWRVKVRPSIPQVLFNIESLTIAITSAHFIYHLPQIQQANGKIPVLLAMAACFFFLTNTDRKSVV